MVFQYRRYGSILLLRTTVLYSFILYLMCAYFLTMLILGAQTELTLVRQTIQTIGYQLSDERISDSGGRLYLLMRAVPAPENTPPYSERELWLGPCLLRSLPAEWTPWLRRKQRLLTGAIQAMLNTRSSSRARRSMPSSSRAYRGRRRIPVAGE